MLGWTQTPALPELTESIAHKLQPDPELARRVLAHLGEEDVGPAAPLVTHIDADKVVVAHTIHGAFKGRVCSWAPQAFASGARWAMQTPRTVKILSRHVASHKTEGSLLRVLPASVQELLRRGNRGKTGEPTEGQ